MVVSVHLVLMLVDTPVTVYCIIAFSSYIVLISSFCDSPKQGRRENSESPRQNRKMRHPAIEAGRKFSGSGN